ncbi:NAD(P)H-dependent oxidoreductase [Azohydromonas aeria]|uniref:NAD(P)H-dependent oxidoreductase n=1 Tax=Azohydromonas aeria TaxID=2590212 RepID=UPI0012FA1124|nr:NAD(P)H-dependent oxidoreductase [Azohydromonas aeria]
MGGMKKVLVIAAHAPGESLGAALAEAYADQARHLGHAVTHLNLNELRFDPVLRRGYRVEQALEPDLTAAQESIRNAGHLAFIYPVWWGSVPAVLKGFIDRVFLPGFAFKYQPGKSFPEQLLKGRSAHVVATMDTPPWYFRWIYWAPGLRQMKKNTLEFCGIRPVKTLALGPVLGSSGKRREQWMGRVRELAEII